MDEGTEILVDQLEMGTGLGVVTVWRRCADIARFERVGRFDIEYVIS